MRELFPLHGSCVPCREPIAEPLEHTAFLVCFVQDCGRLRDDAVGQRRVSLARVSLARLPNNPTLVPAEAPTLGAVVLSRGELRARVVACRTRVGKPLIGQRCRILRASEHQSRVILEALAEVERAGRFEAKRSHAD